MLLYLVSINLAEFQEGIGSKTRRCEIPLPSKARQSPFGKLMGVSKISQLVAAEKAATALTGIDPQDQQAINSQRAMEQEQARLTAEKIELPKGTGKTFILQEIKVDQFNLIRRMVELTPSMCKERNCGYDAAKQAGYNAGWETVPQAQVLPSGKTMGDTLLGLLQYHVATAHGMSNSHIMSEEEVGQQQGWTPVPGFLTAAQA
jgi:hypothetical protein